MPIEAQPPAPIPTSDAKPPSIRDSLSKAMPEEASKPAQPPVKEAKPGPVVEKKPTLKPPGTERGADGKFLPRGAEAKPDAPEPLAEAATQALEPGEDPGVDGKDGAAGQESVAPAGAAKPDGKPEAKSKPPASWRPAAKEAWAKLPSEVQTEVARRESEITTALQKARQAEKEGQLATAAFGKLEAVAKPYAAMLQADGADIPKAFGAYLQTVHSLANGTPATKAAIAADVVRRFGVSVDMLADALEGKPPAQGEQPQAPAAGQPEQTATQRQSGYRDPRMDVLLQSLAVGRQRRAQEVTIKQQRELSAFESDPAHEFLEPLESGREAEPGSVRDLMALAIEAGARQGVDLSLKDAYLRACQLHPEVSKILRQREEAQRAETANAATRQAQAASSSIRSEPAGGPTQKPKGLRDLLAASFDASVSGTR